MMRNLIPLSFVIAVLAACAPVATPAPTAVPPTATPTTRPPTATPAPSATPSPTETPAPTDPPAAEPSYTVRVTLIDSQGTPLTGQAVQGGGILDGSQDNFTVLATCETDAAGMCEMTFPTSGADPAYEVMWSVRVPGYAIYGPTPFGEQEGLDLLLYGAPLEGGDPAVYFADVLLELRDGRLELQADR